MNISILDAYPLNPGDISWAPVEALGNLAIFQDTPAHLVAERVKNADIVLTNKTPLGSSDVNALKNCKMIGVLATGTNILDISALSMAGIVICNVPAYGVADVAEHALALLLELAKGTSLHSQGVKAGEWGRRGWCFWNKSPLALKGLTLGIIGFGAIGQQMGQYGHALGMKVMAYSPHRKGRANYPFSYASPEEIFTQADVISLHCPLTEETRHIINEKSLKLMKPGVILLNTARGELVDEEAAARALASGQLGGLGTDVLAKEPPLLDNPLFNAPNTLITPHMAWATQNARQRIIDIMADNIRAFCNGSPINQINRVIR